ncbi:hypothetical protein [Thiomonas sp.]|jgi:hypothetical protein|nr:hypothetical protein [Thiomonas sp.]
MLAARGVPWDVATSLPPAELMGYCVAAGELEGGRFNWSTLEWESPNA